MSSYSIWYVRYFELCVIMYVYRRFWWKNNENKSNSKSSQLRASISKSCKIIRAQLYTKVVIYLVTVTWKINSHQYHRPTRWKLLRLHCTSCIHLVPSRASAVPRLCVICKCNLLLYQGFYLHGFWYWDICFNVCTHKEEN